MPMHHFTPTGSNSGSSSIIMILLGLEVHLVWTLLTVLSITMVVLGGMVNYFETFLPTALNEAFRYGKASRGRPSHWLLRLIQASIARPIPENQEL